MLIPVFPSKEMSTKKESCRIRLSKKTRQTLSSRVKSKVVGEFSESEKIIPKEKKLIVHKPFLKDMDCDELKNLNGIFGFLPTEEYNKIQDMSNILHDDRIILIGTDPEFCLTNRTDLLCSYAYHVLGDSRKERKFGSDGPCAEIRPTPAGTGNQLLKNMKDCFSYGAENKEVLDNYKWLGGITAKGMDGRTYTLGGQVHIGEPSDQILPSQYKIALRPFIIRVLDELMGVPLARFDGKEGVLRRTSSGFQYGFWGDFRQSKNRFEWRSLSASWLLSPALSETIFELSALITDTIYKLFVEYLSLVEKNLLNKEKVNTSAVVSKFFDTIYPKIKVVDFKTLDEYNKFLCDIGNDPESHKEVIGKILNNLKNFPSNFALKEDEEFKFFMDTMKYTWGDFKPTKDLRPVWLEDKPDPITALTLSKIIKNDKKKKSSSYKIADITVSSDKVISDISDMQALPSEEELSEE